MATNTLQLPGAPATRRSIRLVFHVTFHLRHTLRNPFIKLAFVLVEVVEHLVHLALKVSPRNVPADVCTQRESRDKDEQGENDFF